MRSAPFVNRSQVELELQEIRDVHPFINLILDNEATKINKILKNNQLSKLPSFAQPSPSKLAAYSALTPAKLSFPILLFKKHLDDNFLKRSHLQVRIGKHLWSVLHVAVIVGSLPIVQCLVEAGVETTCLDKYGNSALEYSMFVGNEKIHQYLRNFPCRVSLEEKAELVFSNANDTTYAYHQSYEHLQAHKKNILSVYSQANMDTVMIFGVGNSIDIPIEEISEKCKQLILIDVDSKALERTIAKVAQHNRDKVKIVIKEVTGMLANFIAEIELLKHQITGNNVLYYIGPNVVLGLIESYKDIAFKFAALVAGELAVYKPTFVISSMLLSQLVTSFSNQATRVFPGFSSSVVYSQQTSQLNRALVESHMALLDYVCAEKGVIFVSSDYYAVNKEIKDFTLHLNLFNPMIDKNFNTVATFSDLKWTLANGTIFSIFCKSLMPKKILCQKLEIRGSEAKSDQTTFSVSTPAR